MYTIITVPVPAVAWPRARLAHNTYNCRHTRAQATCAEIGNSRTMGCIRLKNNPIFELPRLANCISGLYGKKERKPVNASFMGRGKARGRDLQAPECLLLEPG